MFKELKETMFKQLKGSIMTMTHQIENINEGIEIIYFMFSSAKSMPRTQYFIL